MEVRNVGRVAVDQWLRMARAPFGAVADLLPSDSGQRDAVLRQSTAPTPLYAPRSVDSSMITRFCKRRAVGAPPPTSDSERSNFVDKPTRRTRRRRATRVGPRSQWSAARTGRI